MVNMVVPAISTETWCRVGHWADIVTVEGPEIDEYSFEQRLNVLLNHRPLERLNDMEAGGDYYIKKYRAGHTRQYYVPGDKVHRPEVSEETAQRLHEWVDDTGTAPMSVYDFEDKVESLLSAMADWGNRVHIQLEEVDEPQP